MSFREPQSSKSTTEDRLSTGDWEGYYADVKHDGMRAIATVVEGQIKIFSRTGHSLEEHIPHIANALSGHLTEGEYLDGEIGLVIDQVSVEGQLVPKCDFNKTMRMMGSLPERARKLQSENSPLSFIVFDHIGQTEAAQQIRYNQAVNKVQLVASDYVVMNPVFHDESVFSTVYETLTSNGIEGLIMKNKSAVYQFGKRANKTWYKVKSVSDADVIVSGYKEGNGKFAGMIGAIEFSRKLPDGSLKYVGRCSGLNDALRREISENRDEYLGRVMTIKFNELVGSKKKYLSCRHPQFVAFRDDKLPEECDGREFINPDWTG